MIANKRIGVIATIGVCLALAASVIMIVFSAEDTSEIMRKQQYISELFGGEIISINIIADKNDWNDMIENASAKEYILADIEVNGTMFNNVGIRTKGNASLSQVAGTDNPERYSLRIKFDKYISRQTCFGLDELVLNNMISDSTYMKEYMSQDVMRYIGVEAPLTNYADISVNNKGFGFYVALESYGESYNMRTQGDLTGNYYNIKSMQMRDGEPGGNIGRPPGNGVPGEIMRLHQDGGVPGNNTGMPTEDIGGENNAGDDTNTENVRSRRVFFAGGASSSGGTLEYTDDKLSSYPAIFENASGTVSNSNKEKVIKALKNLSANTNIEQYFNVDDILRYFAAHTVVVSLDSYYSNMAQNYFLYERNGVVSILPWDYHLSYGTFQSGSSDSIVNFPIDTPVSGVSMSERPLLDKLLSNKEYSAKYHGYLQEIIDGYFNSGLFENTVRTLQNKIGEHVKNDPSALCTYEQFTTAADTLVQLNMLRSESIEGQLAGAIPSTTEGQSTDKTALIDASAINISDLGSMMGGGGPGGFPGGDRQTENGQDGQIIVGGFSDMDGNVDMSRAMRILQETNGEITDEAKEKLLALGLTDEQITMFSRMRQGGWMPGGMSNNQPAALDRNYLTLLGASAAALVGATAVTAKRKRKY